MRFIWFTVLVIRKSKQLVQAPASVSTSLAALCLMEPQKGNYHLQREHAYAQRNRTTRGQAPSCAWRLVPLSPSYLPRKGSTILTTPPWEPNLQDRSLWGRALIQIIQIITTTDSISLSSPLMEHSVCPQRAQALWVVAQPNASTLYREVEDHRAHLDCDGPDYISE